MVGSSLLRDHIVCNSAAAVSIFCTRFQTTRRDTHTNKGLTVDLHRNRNRFNINLTIGSLRSHAGFSRPQSEPTSKSRLPTPLVRAPPRLLRTSDTQTCGLLPVLALRRQRDRSNDTGRTRGTGGSQSGRLASVSAIRALLGPLLVSRAA